MHYAATLNTILPESQHCCEKHHNLTVINSDCRWTKQPRLLALHFLRGSWEKNCWFNKLVIMRWLCAIRWCIIRYQSCTICCCSHVRYWLIVVKRILLDIILAADCQLLIPNLKDFQCGPILLQPFDCWHFLFPYFHRLNTETINGPAFQAEPVINSAGQVSCNQEDY